MERRTFILATIAGGLLAAPLGAEAQQAGRMPRIGVLLPAEPASLTEPNASAFRLGLHDLGYVDGQNVAVEYRHAHGKAELHAELIAELVRLQVHVMVVTARRGRAALWRLPLRAVLLGLRVSPGSRVRRCREGNQCDFESTSPRIPLYTGETSVVYARVIKQKQYSSKVPLASRCSLSTMWL
jgi:hypothetical protein